MTTNEQRKFNKTILEKLDEIKAMIQKEEPMPLFSYKTEEIERQDLRESVINGLFGADKWDSPKISINTFPKNTTKEIKFFDQPEYDYYGSDVCHSGRCSYHVVSVAPRKYEVKDTTRHVCSDEEHIKMYCNHIMEQVMSGFCNTLIYRYSASTSYELPKDASNIQVRQHDFKRKKYIIAFSMDDIAVAFDDQSIEMTWDINSIFKSNTVRMALYMDIQPVRPERMCVIPIH